MTGREKILAALSDDGTPEIPVVICYEGILIQDHWNQLTACPWWYQESPDLDHQIAWRRDFFDKVPQDWFYMPLCVSRAQRKSLSIRESDGVVALVDRQTGHERVLEPPVVGGKMIPRDTASLTGNSIDVSTEDIDRGVPTKILDVQAMRKEGRFDLSDRILAGLGADRFPMTSVHSPLWDASGLWGFEALMTLVATQPELVQHACERFLQRSIQQVQCASARGVLGIWIEECFTDMIGPKSYRTLCLPYLRRLIEAIRDIGLYSVFYFCGDPKNLWELLLDAKADALSLEEGKKGFEIDIEDVVSRVQGRCTLLGNLDAFHVLEQGTDSELHDEIRRQIAAGRANGNRFITSLGSPVTPNTSMESLARYLTLVRESAKTPLRSRKKGAMQA